MKKVVLALLLAVTAFTSTTRLSAQDVTIKDAAEYNEYTAAIGQTAPAAKAAAIETFLMHYPQSVVYQSMLGQLVQAYAAVPDGTKAIGAADRLLKLDPNNASAILTEVYFKSQAAAALTDPAAKQAGLDDAAAFAKRGLALTKPAGTSDADWATLQSKTIPVYHSTIGTAAMNKNDYPTAIAEFTAELKSVPVEATATPSQQLLDTFYLGNAYWKSTPADYLNCVWYTDRAAHFAPAQFQAQFLPIAQYCYSKYHGNKNDFDKVEALQAPTQLNPPDNFGTVVTPAPKPADLAHQALQGVTDPSTLNMSDQEFVLTNGTQKADIQADPAATTPATDADRVWASLKGKNIKLSDKLVISATDTVVTIAVSDDAVAGKTADFSITMKEPLKTVPTVGSNFSVIGTVDSYDKAPVLIHMIDGEPAVKPKAPVHHAPAHRSTN